MKANEVEETPEDAISTVEVEGIPEEIANLTEDNVADGHKTNDVVAIHWDSVNGKIIVDTVNKDGGIVQTYHTSTEDQYKKFEEIFQEENWQTKANTYFKDHFNTK